MKFSPPILLVVALGLSPVFGEDDFLRDAARSDAIMKDAGNQLDSLAREMEISNVFAPSDIISNRQVAAQLTATRNTDMKNVLRSLELSQLQATNLHTHLRSAEAGHRRIARSLLEMGNRLGVGQGTDLLSRDKLLGLKKEVEALAAEADAGKALTEDQQRRADDMARELRATEKAVNNAEAAKAMDQAAAKLETGKPEAAAEEINKALASLDKESNARENESAAAEAKKNALEKAAAQLNALAKQAQTLADNPTTPKAGDMALDMMMKAEEVAKALAGEQQNAEADTVRSAENNLQNNEFSKAAANLEAAAQAASQQAKALSAQMEKALQAQSEALKALANAAAELAALQALQERIDDAAQDQKEALATDANAGEAAQKTADKNKRADQADQLAKDLQAASMTEPAQDVGNAKNEITSDQGAKALKSLESASQSMASAIKNAEAKMNALMAQAQGAPPQPGQPGQPPPPGQPGQLPQPGQPGQPPQPGPPTGQDSQDTKDTESKNLAAGTTESGVLPAEQGAWKSNLTKNERQALLSGQQEKSLPSMTEDVKRYFQNLAE